MSLIEDFTFRDLSSLRRLVLESTLLKQIDARTLTGLLSLSELYLSKSYQLSHIDGAAFSDFRETLKELYLKDTLVNIIETLAKDGLEPPYVKESTLSKILNFILTFFFSIRIRRFLQYQKN